MNNLKQYIKDKNWAEILNQCKSLNGTDRAERIKYLISLDIDRDILEMQGHLLNGQARTDFYSNRQKVDSTLNFALISCMREFEDMKKIERPEHSWNPMLAFLAKPSIGIEPLLKFYELFPPDYLAKVVKASQKDRFTTIDFKILWTFYLQGWIAFDESYFVTRLFTITMFNRNTEEDAAFLLANREAIDRVFLQFHRYEIPVLDISKWKAREGNVCKKVNEFWTEIIRIMQEKGYVFDRILVQHLLESLLNNWKKPHLDWHIRLLDLLNTRPEEYLQHQHLLFSLLNTGSTSLINFAVKQIKEISKAEGFDENGFVGNITAIFPKEKTEKSILLSLDILDSILKKKVHEHLDISSELSMVLLQNDPKVQEKGARLLVNYVDPEILKNVVEPYLSNLKLKTLEILGLDSAPLSPSEEDEAFEAAEQLEQVVIPATWEELLFQIGNFIRTKSALDFDLFLEGLNQLQEEIPADYKKQLKPYCKQLFGRFWDTDLMIFFSEFMQHWVGENTQEKVKTRNDSIPFVKNKLDWMQQKLASKNKLPFLSTPSHQPFYLHPKVLVQRLLQYEQEQVNIEMEDLIIACNRLLYKYADEDTLDLVKRLKGSYAPAVQYYLGAADEVKPAEDMLALWAQVTRIKQPDQLFAEFENTVAKSYPSVVSPFHLDFEVVVDKSEYATWYNLFLQQNWNYSWHRKADTTHYPAFFYNSAPFSIGFRETIPFQMSLMPQYPGPLLCRYIPTNAMGNEVRELENCLYPMQFLMDHQLDVHGSGWLYIAVCLLFEKKISRDLATEYVQFSLLNRKRALSDLADILGKLIARGYAPVNRFIEYLDRPFVSQTIREFQWLCLERILEHFDGAQLPINSKKIIAYYTEVSVHLDKVLDQDLLSKVKRK
ncbi:DUF6493 family protein [Pedobacter caeni]|uniref:Uncharacterized protein n=1 Tax=Pedobacter caeni TaxID=288992 RepID=A0A1M4UCT3_9SPHI|nr:DUF6493 family protein [Pedobacter caeni]SHE54370.1 hypothetical protein SAMN04488522_101506 [Pedobacter caeni]